MLAIEVAAACQAAGKFLVDKGGHRQPLRVGGTIVSATGVQGSACGSDVDE